MKEHYKAINFDLDTNALKLYYPGKEYNQAYYDIRKFMEQNGFSHRQGSGYRSIEQLSDFAVNTLIEELFEKFDWLLKCTKRLDATNIEKNYDLLAAYVKNREIVDRENKSAEYDIVEEELEL